MLLFSECHFLRDKRVKGGTDGGNWCRFKRSEDAKMALEQMEGFELAGRQLRVNTVHEKGSNIKIVGGGPVDSLDENGGSSHPPFCASCLLIRLFYLCAGSLNNNSSRHMLMQKLARTEAPVARPAPMFVFLFPTRSSSV